jgi:hypothetical protein
MGKARRSDLIAVTTRTGTTQGAFARRQGCRGATQLGEDPIDIEQAGRLHDPGNHQIPEHLVTDRLVETQAGIHPGQGLIEQPAA